MKGYESLNIFAPSTKPEATPDYPSQSEVNRGKKQKMGRNGTPDSSGREDFCFLLAPFLLLRSEPFPNVPNRSEPFRALNVFLTGVRNNPRLSGPIRTYPNLSEP